MRSGSFLLFVIVSGVVAFSHARSQDLSPGVPVQVAQAVSRDMSPTSWLAGTVIGHDDARIASEVQGRLIAVLDVGDRVKRGDVIARIEDLPFKLRLAESEARVGRWRARLAYLRREAARLEELAAGNHIAKNRLDEMKSKRGVAEGELKAATALHHAARDELAKTAIRAPFSGVISERMQRSGERVDAGDVIVRLVDPQRLEVKAQVPQRGISHLRVGDELQITDGEITVRGRVRTLVPVGDDRSHLYELRIAFPQLSWKAGQVVRVAVPVAPPARTIAVPRDALVIRRDGMSVFRIVDGDLAERVSVRVGVADGGYVAVDGGILAGDRVVVQGNERLRTGQRVSVIDP